MAGRINILDVTTKHIEAKGLRAARQIATTMRELAPYDETNTDPRHVHVRDSIRIRPSGYAGGITLKWVIGPHTDHDYFAEFGNYEAGDRIYPRKKKVMRWENSTGTHFASSVRTYKGSRFIKRTADKYR